MAARPVQIRTNKGETLMIISSLLLVLAAAMPAAPASNPIHLHPHVSVQDDRVFFRLNNPTKSFRDVKIDGHTYTLASHQTLDIKAPVGTLIYSDSRSYSHKRGDLLLEVSTAQDKTLVRLD